MSYITSFRCEKKGFVPRHCVEEVNRHLTDDERLPNHLLAMFPIKREEEKHEQESRIGSKGTFDKFSLHASNSSRSELFYL